MVEKGEKGAAAGGAASANERWRYEGVVACSLGRLLKSTHWSAPREAVATSAAAAAPRKHLPSYVGSHTPGRPNAHAPGCTHRADAGNNLVLGAHGSVHRLVNGLRGQAGGGRAKGEDRG